MIYYAEYAPVKTSTVKDGDIMLVRNYLGNIGVNHIYRMSQGEWVNIPNPYQGREGVLDYIKQL